MGERGLIAFLKSPNPGSFPVLANIGVGFSRKTGKIGRAAGYTLVIAPEMGRRFRYPFFRAMEAIQDAEGGEPPRVRREFA